MPLGATVARAGVMEWKPGAHASTFGGNPVSVAASLATIELAPDNEGGCRLTYTEQGIYQGGDADVANRKAGCEELCDKLALELDTCA